MYSEGILAEQNKDKGIYKHGDPRWVHGDHVSLDEFYGDEKELWEDQFEFMSIVADVLFEVTLEMELEELFIAEDLKKTFSQKVSKGEILGKLLKTGPSHIGYSDANRVFEIIEKFVDKYEIGSVSMLREELDKRGHVFKGKDFFDMEPMKIYLNDVKKFQQGYVDKSTGTYFYGWQEMQEVIDLKMIELSQDIEKPKSVYQQYTRALLAPGMQGNNAERLKKRIKGSLDEYYRLSQEITDLRELQQQISIFRESSVPIDSNYFEILGKYDDLKTKQMGKKQYPAKFPISMSLPNPFLRVINSKLHDGDVLVSSGVKSKVSAQRKVNDKFNGNAAFMKDSIRMTVFSESFEFLDRVHERLNKVMLEKKPEVSEEQHERNIKASKVETLYANETLLLSAKINMPVNNRRVGELKFYERNQHKVKMIDTDKIYAERRKYKISEDELQKADRAKYNEKGYKNVDLIDSYEIEKMYNKYTLVTDRYRKIHDAERFNLEDFFVQENFEKAFKELTKLELVIHIAAASQSKDKTIRNKTIDLIKKHNDKYAKSKDDKSLMIPPSTIKKYFLKESIMNAIYPER